MARLAASLLLLVAALIPALLIAGGPARDDAGVKRALALQRAMQEARFYLQHGSDSQKAVELLEGQLAHVDGNREFLRLLGDAYRARIRDLYLAGQPAQAQVFLGRLSVLDPAAANDPALRPQAEAPPRPPMVEPPPAKPAEPKPASIFPDFGKLFKLGGTKVAQAPVKPAVARGVSEDVVHGDDPFDARHRRDVPETDAQNRSQIEQLVAKGDAEFKNKHYELARTHYEEAQRRSPNALTAPCRERLAYCVFDHVAAEIKGAPALSEAAIGDLRQRVQSASALGPTAAKTGKQILEQLDDWSRRRGPTASAAAAAPVSLHHLGRNAEGWQVSETANFRIFHKQDDAFAERVAEVAERTRREAARKWFGGEAPVWAPRCELIVYPSGTEYRRMTGTLPFDAPGHAQIHSIKNDESRIVARWLHMRFDIANMLDTVLPHETTHVVLAGRFGALKIPRWADEGIAVLSEPAYKIQQHRENLMRAQQAGTLHGLKQLMTMDYPTDQAHISAFYAQSVALVEFLSSQRGPTVFTAFVRDGLRDGYDAAVQRHYGMSFAQLEQAWNQQMRRGQAVAAGQ